MDPVEDRLKEALREVLREKVKTNSQKKHPLKTAAAISGAIIILLTITIQSGSFIKNPTAFKNDNTEKASNYTIENEMYEYLDVVNTCVRSREWKSKKKSAPIIDSVYQYNNLGQI